MASSHVPFNGGPLRATGAVKSPVLSYHLAARGFVTYVRCLLPRLLAAGALSKREQLEILLVLCALDDQLDGADLASARRTKHLCESLSQHLLPSLPALEPDVQLEYRAWVRWYLSVASA